MEIEERTGGDIQKIEKDIHGRAGLGNIRPGQRNMSRSRCIGLHDRRSIVNKV